MTDPVSPGTPPPPERPVEDRLESWKEIAAYMRRDVTTVQRWEKREGMPVHRHVHDKIGSVYAFRSDLDAWTRNRRPPEPSSHESDQARNPRPVDDSGANGRAAGHPRFFWPLVTAGAALAVSLTVWYVQTRVTSPENPLAHARFQALTDFPGTEQAAALSDDGKFVAFLSDRDGQMDVWVGQVGTGRFYNLTRGTTRDIVNPSVRTLGFSPDGTLVTFWVRSFDASNASEISVWGVPVLGGAPRPYIDGGAEFDWSDDGSRVVYHTPGPGDPMFVRESLEGSHANQIFSAPPGLHSHFPLWSPDQAFIYFVQGSVPDRMDIWRIRPTGGAAERITRHDSLVSHPVFIDARTLLYLASDRDGSGPWIHRVDVERRVPQRVSVGVDRYTSLAASTDGRRLVATLASPKGTLWRLPVAAGRADPSTARPVPLTTGNGSSPRLGPRFLLYVSSKGTGDSIWKLEDDAATELWSATDSRVIGAPAIARDGRRVAFSVRRNEQTLLYVANTDGTDARVVAGSLALQGSPAWAPDERSITVAAEVEGTPRLFAVPIDGGAPTRFVEEHSVDPVWSPDGDVVAFSGADIGTTFPVRAVKADGTHQPVADIRLTRGARHLAFMGRRSLVVLRGEGGHKNLWVVDLESGAARQLTSFSSDFQLRDFDVSPDGRELVLEQVQEHSDVVLIELPPR